MPMVYCATQLSSSCKFMCIYLRCKGGKTNKTTTTQEEEEEELLSPYAFLFFLKKI